MSSLVGVSESRVAVAPDLAPPLDEAVWDARMARGRVEELRNSASRVRALKWITIAALCAAAVWSAVTPYDTAIRFAVCAGALFTMFEALDGGHHVFAALFGALVLLYNPVLPLLDFSGDWQMVVLFASVIPFVVSFAWHNSRLVEND